MPSGERSRPELGWPLWERRFLSRLGLLWPMFNGGGIRQLRIFLQKLYNLRVKREKVESVNSPKQSVGISEVTGAQS